MGTMCSRTTCGWTRCLSWAGTYRLTQVIVRNPNFVASLVDKVFDKARDKDQDLHTHIDIHVLVYHLPPLGITATGSFPLTPRAHQFKVMI